MADPASLTVSGLALGFSIASFAWQHWRKVDSVVCTLVANEVRDKHGVFQFSFANLGTRPALLRDIRVEIFMRPELDGTFIGNSTTPAGHLPQVIKAGEMFSTTVEARWAQIDLNSAAQEAEGRGCETGVAELFFVARAIVWNPKGDRFIGEKHIVTFSTNIKSQSSRAETFYERSFKITRVLGQITRKSVGQMPKAIGEVVTRKIIGKRASSPEEEQPF